MKKKITDGMLAKYISGEASDEEVQSILLWLAENNANGERYEQFRLLWDATGKFLDQNVADEEAAWNKFERQIATKKKTPAIFSLNKLSIAAGIALLVLGGITYFFSTKKHDVQISYANNTVVNSNGDSSEKNICNTTSCPIEICIVQALRCNNKQQTEVSTCSTIEPDEAGRLSYNAFGSAKNCKAIIKEVRITKIATGESIVLTDRTKITAQDFFKYITGQKIGNIVAGIFHTDCNNNSGEHELILNNQSGSLLLQ